jgi:hypothetical protein
VVVERVLVECLEQDFLLERKVLVKWRNITTVN